MLAALGRRMVGYHWLEGRTWIDAYLNAAAGIVFLLGVGVVLAPVVHRALHHFHLSEKA